MSDKNPEAVGCDASIMKNVWEIRLREQGQKKQSEQERLEKSALKSINKEWATRISSKQKYPKRLESKAKSVDTQTENQSPFNKGPQISPPSMGSSPIGRGGGLGRSYAAPVPSHKDKKGHDKRFSKLQLLMFITQTQPSPMVWGKCWKYNKSLPPPTEGAAAPSDWGQCWRFANQQPHAESGQPWPNGPKLVDYHSLHIYEKSAFRMMESKDLDLSLPVEEWQMSWKNANHQKEKKKNETSSSRDGGNVSKFWMFTSLDETQHHNEAQCSSEWSESWKSTKPPKEGQQAPSNGPQNGPIDNKQHKDGKASSQFGECWKFINHQLHHKSKSSPAKKSHNPEWVDSWRAAKIVSNNHKKPHHTPAQGPDEMYDFHQESQESHLHKVIMFVSPEQKYRDLWSSQFRDEHQPLSEWDKSWEVTKNNSKPSEEIERALRAGQPKMDTPEGEKPKEHKQMSEPMAVDPHYEQLKHEVIYRPKRGFTEKMMHRLKQLDKTLWGSEWREDSWRSLKHRIRMERRRTRPHPSRPFREPERGGERKPDASDWKDSWSLTNLSLHQEADLWQQGWSSMPRIRPYRAMEQNHFVPVGFSQNGPTGARSWGDSWRFSRCQHRLEATGQVKQARQASPDGPSHQHEDSHHHSRRRVRSIADWQDAWMVSESQFHHDRPSLTQWMEAWRWSAFHTDRWWEQLPRHNWMDKSLEIRSRKEKLSLQNAKAKMSQSFECQIFRERYPEKQWNESWMAASLLSHHQSSGVHEEKTSHSHSQQPHTTSIEYGSQWGKSFRLANPMPHGIDQSWVDCSANQSHYMVMWSRGNCIRSHLYANFNKDSSMFRLWSNSSRFLKGPSSQLSDAKHSRGKSKESASDPWEIARKKMKTRKYIYINIDQCKPSDRKWAGCHLLGKTQPRPKRSYVIVKTPKAAAETNDRFFEEWAGSWRFFVQAGSLKKQMPAESLSGWGESWKFLLPLYPPQNGPKDKAK